MGKIQVLVATMHQKDYSLLDKMNISSSAIVANQCDENKIEQFEHKGQPIKWLSFAERGVGLNRNNALMRADGEYCLFADDDMVYVDDYEKIIENAFTENPKADVIVFNLIEDEPSRYVIPRKLKVGKLNFLRYGTARVAVRLSSVKREGIYFNQCFGGGTERCHGEDNLFLAACLQKGLKIIAIPDFVAKLIEDRPSSWNNGYNEKYLIDQGVLYYTLSKKWWRILCLQDAFRRRKSYASFGFFKAYKLMIKGVKDHLKR